MVGPLSADAVSEEAPDQGERYARFILESICDEFENLPFDGAYVLRLVRSTAGLTSMAAAPYRRGKKTSRRLVWDKDLTRELFVSYRIEGDEAARDELVEMYLNLVKYLASRFRNRGEPIDDLIQVGTIGLIKAIDRFDIERAVEFTTYATPTIVGELKRYFRDKGWAIKVPRRLQELSFKVNQAVDALTQRLQRSPMVPEIAEYLDVTPDEVLEALETFEAYNFVLARDRSQLRRVGVLLDPRVRWAGRRARCRSSTIAPCCRRRSRAWPRRSSTCSYLRFFQGLTQTEIAHQLGISQMQVSRLLRKTLRALREDIVPDGTV